MRCAVFASGGGTNFQSLLDHIDSGELHAEIACVIGNNSKAYAFERARAHAIPAVHLAPSQFDNEDRYVQRLIEVLRSHQVELIVLAGYMKMIPARIVQAYPNRIVNIHPALLPAFGGKGLYGKAVHEAVLAYGAKISGVTVHFVDEQYDHGPIILQRATAVLDNDTPDSLAKRVLALEHDSYWRAIEAIANGSVRVQGNRVLGGPQY